MMELKNKLSHLFGKIIICIGVLVFMFPVFQNLQSERKCQNIGEIYKNAVLKMDETQRKNHLAQGEQYNLQLKNSDMERKDYWKVLDPLGNGMIGLIEIPKIEVSLPIYHGVGEEVLEKGIGHMAGSSFPIGGSDTHSLLAGHRGTPNAALFVRLGDMKIGDVFYVSVCHQTLAYKVCEIAVIRPEDTKELGIQEKRDLISLITCTPYGINTHRLVVTGERMEEDK